MKNIYDIKDIFSGGIIEKYFSEDPARFDFRQYRTIIVRCCLKNMLKNANKVNELRVNREKLNAKQLTLKLCRESISRRSMKFIRSRTLLPLAGLHALAGGFFAARGGTHDTVSIVKFL